MSKNIYINGSLATEGSYQQQAELIGFPARDSRQSAFSEISHDLRYGTAAGTRTAALSTSDKVVAAFVFAGSVLLLAFAIVLPFI